MGIVCVSVSMLLSSYTGFWFLSPLEQEMKVISALSELVMNCCFAPQGGAVFYVILILYCCHESMCV